MNEWIGRGEKNKNLVVEYDRKHYLSNKIKNSLNNWKDKQQKANSNLNIQKKNKSHSQGLMHQLFSVCLFVMAKKWLFTKSKNIRMMIRMLKWWW